MRFIVNRMPNDSDECPFFKNGICALDFKKCEYFTEENYRYDTMYHSVDSGDCYYLKPLESEDTE